jgi:hypothetical protein
MHLYQLLSPKEIHRLLTQVHGDDVVRMHRARKWFRGFKCRRKDVHVDDGTARPITSRTDAKAARVEKRILGEQKSHSSTFYPQISQ